LFSETRFELLTAVKVKIVVFWVIWVGRRFYPEGGDKKFLPNVGN
jgi:hypothetical protein